MKINDFAKEITLEEGLKKSVNVGNVKEILRLVNKKLNGEFYGLIRKA